MQAYWICFFLLVVDAGRQIDFRPLWPTLYIYIVYMYMCYYFQMFIYSLADPYGVHI